MSSHVEDSLDLHEISGPSAFGGDWKRFWHLLWLIAVTEFRVHYIGSFLGYVWTLLRPLLFFGVVFVVVRRVLGFGAGVEHYWAILMLGIILFQYFRDATNQAVRSVSARENMVRRMQFPRIVIPLSVSLTAAFTLCLNLLVGFCLLVAFGVEPRWTWLLILVVLIPLVLVTTAMAVLLSVLFVRSEDVAQVWSVIGQLLFYASPILYPIEFVPDSLRLFVTANPLAPIFEQARVWVIDPAAPNAVEAAGGAVGLLFPALLLIAVPIFSVWVFRREAPRVAEAL